MLKSLPESYGFKSLLSAGYLLFSAIGAGNKSMHFMYVKCLLAVALRLV